MRCLTSIAIALMAAPLLAQGLGDRVTGLNQVTGPDVIPLQAPAQIDSAQPSDRLLAQVITQLEHRPSVTARLRHQISLRGSQLYGIGSYWQQGSGENLRIRWELQIAGQQASLLQVSNGRFLWTDQQLPTGRTITRVDLRKLRTAPSIADRELNAIGPGEASWSPIRLELTAHSGGLPSLLAALDEHFAFSSPQAMRLTLTPPKVSKETTIRVFAMVGRWKKEKYEALLHADEPPHNDPKDQIRQPLPDYLPEEVLLLVGQEDLFPYRIEYRRLTSNDSTKESPSKVLYDLSAEPMVLLELSQVAFGTAIPPGQFDYTPGDTDWEDRTAQHLDRLQQRHEKRLATKHRKQQQGL